LSYGRKKNFGRLRRMKHGRGLEVAFIVRRMARLRALRLFFVIAGLSLWCFSFR